MVDYEVEPNTTECMCSDLQTEDYSPLYAKCNLALIIFALPPLSFFGVCTNIVNVYIYSRKRMQNSANTYLLFLACSDFLVILTGLFIFWIGELSGRMLLKDRRNLDIHLIQAKCAKLLLSSC
ncbi:unnamed protein product [Cylicostephanus goldi]|uniref:G-protein coupled receptors family 1 profile domain-containing protein n=1 Tax=Cylicostephanus goldi TaxID=71465 RepID=A0A3P7NKQ6_CYLGO|nr:unnamed protein product [Cylicostephanus goldi]